MTEEWHTLLLISRRPPTSSLRDTQRRRREMERKTTVTVKEEWVLGPCGTSKHSHLLLVLLLMGSFLDSRTLSVTLSFPENPNKSPFKIKCSPQVVSIKAEHRLCGRQ